MTDLSQTQYQKFLQRKKNLPNENQEILERASAVDQDTVLVAQKARLALQKSAQKQQQTTNLLRSQGEKLQKVDENVSSICENAKESKQLTKEIQDAGRFFNFKLPFYKKVKRFFSRKHKEEVSEMPDYQNEEIHGFSDEEVEAQDPVEKELLLIDKSLKGMRSEGDTQIKLLRSHKDRIDTINRKNARAEHYLNTTNHELKKT